MPENEIYGFLKQNKLTDLDEKSWTEKYSTPEKAKEVHSFMAKEGLTDLGETEFYDKYLKKKVVSTPTTSNGLEGSSTQELGSSGKTKTVEEFNAKYGTNYTDLKTGQTKVDNAEKGVLVPFSPIKVKQPSGEKDFIAPKTTLPDLTKAPMKRYEKAYNGITARIDNNSKEFEKLTAEAEKQGKEQEGVVNKYNAELKQASTVIGNELKAKYEGLLKTGSISAEDANLKFKEEYQKGYDVAQKQITSKYKPILDSYTSLLEKRKTVGNSINGDIERAKLLSGSVGIIERNVNKQILSEVNSFETKLISGLTATGSALAGTMPYFLRFTNNNLAEYAAKNNMPELAKIAFQKQEDASKSEMLQKMEAESKRLAQRAAYLSSKVTEKEGTVVDNFSKGDYLQAGKVAALGFVESLPMMGVAIGISALTGGTASAIIPGGFVFGAQNYYGEYADRTDMSEEDKLNASFIKGSLETITELSVKPLLGPLKELVKTGGKEVAKEAIEKTLFGAIKDGYSKALPYFGWIQEGGSEYVNEIGSVITDKIFDPKFQNKDWGEVLKEGNRRGWEAFGPGAFGGAALTLPVAINNTINQYKNKKEARSFASELEKIEQDIQNPNLTEAQKDILIARKQEIHGKLNEIFDADKQETAGATTEQVSALDDINDQQDEVQIALQDETISPESKEAFELKAKELAEQEKAVIEEIKANEIINEEEPNTADNGLSNDNIEPIVKNGQRITVGNNTGELHSDEGIPYLILDDGSELEISNSDLKTAKLAEDNRNYRIDKNGFFEIEGETHLNPKVTFNDEGYVIINSDGGKVVKGQLAENIAYELALQKMDNITDEEAEILLGEVTTNEDIQKLITENEKRNEQIKSQRAIEEATKEGTNNANEQGETEEQLIEKVKRIDDDVQAANELILETLSVPENAVVKFTPKGSKEALAYTVAKNKKGGLDIRLNNTKIKNPKVIQAITKLYNEGKGLREEAAYNEAHNQLEDLKAQIHKENGFDYTPQYKGETAETVTTKETATNKEEEVENKEPKKKANISPIIQRMIDKIDMAALSPTQRVVLALIGNLDKRSYIEHGGQYSHIEGREKEKGGLKNPDAFKVENNNIKLNFIRKNASPIDQVVMGVMSDMGIEDYDIMDLIQKSISIIESSDNLPNLIKKLKGEVNQEEIERHEADQAFREEQAQRLAEEQQQEFIEELVAQEAIDEPLVFELNGQEIEQVEELGITEETEELTAEQFEALEALLFGEPQPINNNENGNEKEVKQGEDSVTPKQGESKEPSRQNVKGAAETELDKQIESAKERLAKARKTFQEKSKEFGGRAMGDLFGKTEKEGLFDIEIETGADTKAIKPYKEAVLVAQKELDELQDPKRREKAVEFDKKQNKLDLEEDAELIELKKQLKAAKLTSDKKVIQEKIDILLEKQPKSKQSRFVPQASEGVKQKQQSIIEKLKQAFPNIEIVEDETQLNEVLAKSGARQMNNNGVVYGAIYNGRIYLNPTAIRLDTPIHEFGHIWLDIAKNKYAEYYQNLINTIKATPYFEAAQLAYPDLTETQQAEEAVVQAIAEKGIEQLEAQDKKGVLRKVFDAIKAMGKAILKGLGIKNDMNFLKATWQDLVNNAAQDILSGKPITYATSEDIANMDIDAYPISIEGGLLDTSRKGVDRFVSKLTDKKFEGIVPYLREMFKVGGNYPTIRNLDNKRINNISEYLKQTEGVVFEYRKLMKEWAKGKTDAQINKAIQAMQVALTKSVDALAMNNVPNEFKSIITRMRNNVDGFSQLLLDSGFIDPNTELAASISANLGIYMNRSYAAFVDTKWNEMMFPDSNKRTPIMEKIYKDAYNFIRNQYDNFVEVDDKIYTLTTDGNGNITGVIDSEENPVNASETELLTKIQKAYNNKEKLTVDEINNILKEFARFNKDNQFGKGGKIGKMDLSLFKKRQDIAEPLRAFLGEYTEPQAMYINTMTKMAEYIENQKFLADLKKMGEGKIFFDKPIGDYNIEITGQKEYSPLSGLYTSDQINNALKQNDHELLNPDNTFVKIWYAINGFIKFGFTGLSVKSQIRNFGSNILIGFVNGYYNPYSRVKGAIKNPFKLAWGELNKEGGDELAELAKYGVLETSAIGGELKDIVKLVFKDAYSREFNSPESAVEWLTQKTTEATSKFLNKAADIYKLGDNVHKIFNFYAELGNVQYMFPNKTIEEQKTIAADRFNAVNINYNMVPEVVQYLRKNPLLAAFPTFAAEAIRITYNIPALAMSDIKNGMKSKNQQQVSVGINRLSCYTLGMMATALIPYFIGKAAGADDDDDRLIRETAPEYSKNAPKVILKKNGTNYEVMDLSWQNPLNAPQIAYSSFKNNSQGALESFSVATLEVLKPFLSSEISTKILVDISKNDNGSGYKIYNTEDNFWNQTTSISEYIFRQARPGIVKEVTNIYKGAVGREEFGRKYELGSELKQTVTGTKVYSIDAVKKLSSLSYKYQSIFEQDYKLYSSVKAEKSNTPDYAERVDKAFELANKRYAERQQEILNYIQLLQKKGVSDTEIYDKIKSIGGPYNRNLAKMLIFGQIDQFEK